MGLTCHCLDCPAPLHLILPPSCLNCILSLMPPRENKAAWIYRLDLCARNSDNLICISQSSFPTSTAIWRKVLKLTDMLKKWTWLRNDGQQLPKGRGMGAESFHWWFPHFLEVLLASKNMSEPTDHAQFAFHKLKHISCFLTFYFQSSFGHNLA